MMNSGSVGSSLNHWLSSMLGPMVPQLTCTPPASVNLLISEFRPRGSGGGGDEFVEIYNNSDSPLTVCTADGSAGYALVASDGSSRFIIPNGTTITARGHYLGVHSGYSLAASATPDYTYTVEVADNTGLALFNTAAPSGFTSTNRLDAVGFTPEANTLYREGAGLTSIASVNGEITFYRKLNSGTPQDTGDNAADFNFVSPSASFNGAAIQLGWPGPENHSSPIQRNSTVAVVSLDPAVAASVSPNRVRCTTCIEPNANTGTLVYRRNIINNTGRTIAALRVRTVHITTLNSPGYVAGGSQADVRVLSSNDVSVTLTDGSTVAVKGTTLEQPPSQALGGGLNSTLSVPLPPGGLAAGQTIKINMTLGVAQGGSFSFFIIAEASFDAPAAPSALTATAVSSGQVNLSWVDNSTNETEFRIERKVVGGSFAHVATVGAGVTSYQNTGLSSSASYVYRVVATNDGGKSSASNEAGTTTPTSPPSVSIVSPANNASFTTPSNVMIDASASDADGTVTKVEFFQGATKLGEDASAPYSFTWNNVASGNYTLTAKATDNAGATTTSNAVNIIVSLPVVSITATDASAGEMGTDVGVFTVSRSGSTAAALTVNFTVGGIAINGTDYAAITSPLTIPAGAASANIAVTPVNDALVEGSETVAVTLSSSGSFTLDAAASSASLVIADDDFAEARLKQYVTWTAITNGADNGNGTYRHTAPSGISSARAVQMLARGDGYFEATSVDFGTIMWIAGTNGAYRQLQIGTGGWAAIVEDGVNVAMTCCSGQPLMVHVAGDRYRFEITGNTLRYVKYRGANRYVIYTSANPPPAFPLTLYGQINNVNNEWRNTVVAQITQNVTWATIANGIDLGGGSVRKTSADGWNFGAVPQEKLLAGDGYFESTASATHHQSIYVLGADGAQRALVFGTGGWAGIYENGVSVADTCCMPSIIPVHIAGTRYRIEVSNGKLSYVLYRGGARTLMYTSTNPLPAYPLTLHVDSSPQNAEWQNTIIAQTSRNATWTPLTNGIDLGGGSVRKTSSGSWDFTAIPQQKLLAGDGYFESTASSTYHQSINLIGADGTSRTLVFGTGGWAGIYENGVSVADTCCMPSIIPVHIAGTRYRLEIAGGALRYVLYRGGVRTLMYTSTNPLPPYPLSLHLGSSPQNAEWQNTIVNDNTPEYNAAAFVSQSVPTAMQPGQVYSVSVTMKNTGASIWTPDKDYRLGSLNPADNQTWGLTRVNLASPVLPGANATFNFNVTAPSTPNVYNFQWQMLQERVERFGDATTNFPITVNNTSPSVNITAPVNGATFTAPATITINATATDADGTITKVEFFEGATKLGEDTTSPYSFVWSNVAAGSYSLMAKATDNLGASTTSAAVNISAALPSVSITATDPTASEPGTDKGTFTVNRTGDTAAPLTVGFTVFGTSSNGIDYSSTGLTATIPAGALSANIIISPIDDTQVEGSESATFTLASSVNYTIGAPNSATITINDNDTHPPTASITAPANGATFTAPATITINATATDSDGTITKVEFFQGATKLGEDTSFPYSFVWNNVAAGNYSLTVKATDNMDATVTSAAVNISVALPSVSITAPDAAAGEAGGNTGTFTVTRTGSTAAPLTVNYGITGTAVNGSDYSTIGASATILAGASSANIIITPVDDTTVEVSETVILTLATSAAYTIGAPGSATVNITDNDTNPPTVSITAPVNNATYTASSTITINANATDSDGSIAKVEFFQGATKLGEDTSFPYSFTWSNVPANGYTLTARATDNMGATTTSAAISVWVKPPPIAVITSPSSGAVFTIPATVIINVNSWDDEGGQVAKVEFFQNGIKLGESTWPPYSFMWNNAPSGSYTLTAKATDAWGGVVTSAPVNISVTQHPEAQPGGPYSGTIGSAIQFDGSASTDADGTITAYNWNFGDGTTGTGATPTHTYQSAGNYTVTLTVTDNHGIASAPNSTVASVSPPFNFSTARLDPSNATGGEGVNPLSRNYNWSVPLLSLPGRAGLDLGLTLSYNSLVWTKDNSSVTFDADWGFPAPGFRLGFPIIQPRHNDPQVGANAYLLIAPSGDRVQVRQVGSSNIYESADTTYMRLTDNGGSMTLLTADGAQLLFMPINGNYRCTEVRDRNGNFISVTYDDLGQIVTIKDTLGRVITFNYDSNRNLISITQPWTRELENGTTTSELHTWATFGYGAPLTLGSNAQLFNGLNVVGMQGGSQVPVLRQLGLDNGSYFKFEYTMWGQVWKITHFAADSVSNGVPQDNHPLSYTSYNLPGAGGGGSPQTDCPRFTLRRSWAEYGVGDVQQSQEVVTTYSDWTPDAASCVVTPPDATPTDASDNVVIEETYATSANLWMKGLKTKSEVKVGGQVKKTTTWVWKQDNLGLSYPDNPRVEDISVVDSDNNTRRRTEIKYRAFTIAGGKNINLPEDVIEYKADAVTPLRTARTEYDMRSEYTSRRLIALPSFHYLYEGVASAPNLRAKVRYVRDDDTLTDYLVPLPAPATQHYDADFGSTLRWRGNVNRVRNFEVDQQSGLDNGNFTETRTGFHLTGTVAFTEDADNHRATMSFADAFFDDPNNTLGRNALAYPTAVTDADGYTSKSWYSYSTGAVTKTQAPKANTKNNELGPEAKVYYDAVGRMRKTVNLVTNTHTEWLYPASMNLVESYSTIHDDSITNPALRAYAATALTGDGRIRGTASDLPVAGATGRYTGMRVIYDVLGRTEYRSNPTEITMSNGWTPAGDDFNNGQWRWIHQRYDWQGRPTVTTNVDGTTRVIDYGGCGCAGGDVMTLSGEALPEGRRRQKVYHDVLGRAIKAETLNWDGTVYSTTATEYNVRNQITRVKRYKGEESSGIFQESTTQYDGHGRPWKHHTPGQVAGRDTVITYFADSEPQTVTDARGAKTIYTYNGRHQMTSVAYDLSGVIAGQNVAATSGATFDYDAAGNRLWMDDGSGRIDYAYDELSRLRTETRVFDGVGTFALNYDYTLAGQLKSLVDPWGSNIDYGYDTRGRLTGVTGPPVGTYASGIEYRAWGGLKKLTYGNGLTLSFGYDARMQTETFTATADSGAVTMTNADYTYYPDGNVKYARETTGTKFNRAYSYDHAGRLSQALTGSEADDFINGTNSGTETGPYKQVYGYDVWNNMTSRTNRFWDLPEDSFEANFNTNNRNEPPWHYDADGRVLMDDDLEFTYDAEGRVTRTLDVNAETFPLPSMAQTYDGDGRQIKALESTVTRNGQPLVKTTYSVRSSVLGGMVVAEVRQASGVWQKFKGYVYAGGSLIAEQSGTANAVKWISRDPLTGSRRTTTPDYPTTRVGGRVEFDPMGVNVGIRPPIRFEVDRGMTERGMPGIRFDSGFDFSCTLDGIAFDCASVNRLINSGAAVPCPNNDCGPRRVDVSVTYESGRRETFTALTSPFWAGANGASGFWMGPALLPDGFNMTLTGSAARIAGAWFNFGMPDLRMAIGMGVNAGIAASINILDGVGALPFTQSDKKKTDGFDGGSPNPKAQLGPCPELEVLKAGDLEKRNPGALSLLQNMLGSKEKGLSAYDMLTTYQKAVLLNTAAAAVDGGVNLSKAEFNSFYLSTKPGNLPYGIKIEGASGKLDGRSGFGKGVGAIEVHTSKDGITTIDVDLFNVKRHPFDHQGEINFNDRHNRPTHPGDVARQLAKRKVDSGVKCKATLAQ